MILLKGVATHFHSKSPLLRITIQRTICQLTLRKFSCSSCVLSRWCCEVSTTTRLMVAQIELNCFRQMYKLRPYTQVRVVHYQSKHLASNLWIRDIYSLRILRTCEKSLDFNRHWCAYSKWPEIIPTAQASKSANNTSLRSSFTIRFQVSPSVTI